MKLGYEDWEFNIRLGSYNHFGKRLPKPLFHYNVSNSGMLISKSSKSHLKIYKYIIKKNYDLYKFKNIIKIWLHWRKNHPVIHYSFLYLFI